MGKTWGCNNEHSLNNKHRGYVKKKKPYDGLFDKVGRISRPVKDRNIMTKEITEAR